MDQLIGWRMDLERLVDLQATATAFNLPMMGQPPQEVDPRGFMKNENQGSVGACQGHDISDIMEYCYHVAYNAVVQFSRAHGYYGTQRRDGLLGRDQGSTIAGGVDLVQQVGLVLESEWPYDGRYNPNPPGGWNLIDEIAGKFKAGSHSVLNGVDQNFNYLASGVGAISLGTSWGFEPNATGVVEIYADQRRGGHATPLLGYSRRKDSQGRNYFWLHNSWGEGWGNQGWAEIAPSALAAALAVNGSVAIGVSDLKSLQPRRFSWAEKSAF